LSVLHWPGDRLAARAVHVRAGALLRRPVRGLEGPNVVQRRLLERRSLVHVHLFWWFGLLHLDTN
jgi:hypothetical protein